MSFSKRTAWDLTESALTAAIRSTQQPLIDLTISNPTECEFTYSLEPLAAPTEYQPDPCGLVNAREAVAQYYQDHRAGVTTKDLVLTTSTSEAYSFILRLLCDAGDEVLVAQPSYPLFTFLAQVEDVVLRPYALFYDFGWWIDFSQLERSITPRTRAIVVVHPNNPTGHITLRAERRALEALCVTYGLALIVDEVFLDYAVESNAAAIESFATGEHPCLTFVVSGLSKIAALPQMKVGWLAVLGPQQLCVEARNRLEVVADTFLSMNAPVQHALPQWLAGRGVIQRQIIGRIRANLLTLASSSNWTYLPVQAGWSAILQLPQSLGSDDLAERLVNTAGVVTHPASFYELAGTNRLVVSLIVPCETFAAGLRKLDQWCEGERSRAIED